MFAYIATILFLYVFSIPTVFAGAGSSGGGQLFGYDKNPWFVDNTRVVRYCIDRDPARFAVDEDAVDRIFQKAVRSWRDFSDYSATSFGCEYVDSNNCARVATQMFERKSCSENPDVRILLGKLLDADKPYLPFPNEFVSAAIRTDYDLENLKSKGFIYIAADSGPLRPSPESMMPNPWTACSGCVLERVLVHELGHIFGLNHVNDELDIMGETHLEKIVNIEHFTHYIENDVEKFNAESSLYNYAENREFVHLSQLGFTCGRGWCDAFRVPEGAMLRLREIQAPRRSKRYVVEYVENGSGTGWNRVGEIRNIGDILGFWGQNNLAILRLPPQQRVYPQARAKTLRFLSDMGSMFFSGTFYHDASGEMSPLSMRLEKNGTALITMRKSRDNQFLIEQFYPGDLW